MADLNSIAKIANEFVSEGGDNVVDIVTFCEAPWGLNFRLLPAQRFVLKAFYGIELDNNVADIDVPDLVNEHILYTFTEQEFLRYLYEEGRSNTNEVTGKSFHELLLVIGRRGGKSTLCACVCTYEIYKLIRRGDPAKYYGMPPNKEIYIENVAPTDEQACIVYDMVQSQVRQCPYLRDRVVHSTMTYFDLLTDQDMKMVGKPIPSITCLTGGCSANALRGKNSIVVSMDESAFFIDNDGRFSGSAVYKALTPSTADFGMDGKVLNLSSPYAKFGHFYDRYLQSKDEPDVTLMFKMYTAMINTRISSAVLKSEWRKNRSSFMCEFGGEFSDTVTAWIEDENEFRKCVSSRPRSTRGTPDVAYYIGIDLGFKNDGTSISIVHKDKNGKICLDYADVWFSGSSDVWESSHSLYVHCNKYAINDLLKMADIVNEIKELNRWFPLKSGIFDQHNGYALAELLIAAGFKQFIMENFSETTNSEVYETTKRLYCEQLLDLYNHPVLIPELLSLQATRKSGGKIKVSEPDRFGMHNDISDAFVRAVWLCNRESKDRPQNVVVGAGRCGMSVRTSNSDTMSTFSMNKLKRHGDHPRLSYFKKKR